MGVLKTLCIAAFVVLFFLPGMSQDTVPSAHPSDGSSPRTTRTLLITADPSNADLTAGDLEVKEDGKPGSIVSIRRLGRIPLHYCLLVDVSGSLAKDFDFEKKAVSSFLDKAIRPGLDHGWVILFSEGGDESTETSDLEPIKSVISSAVPRGGTMLYDAIASCAHRMLRAERENGEELRAMFLFSDGEDDASQITLQQTADIVLKPGLRIYGLTPASMQTRAQRAMTILTKTTGGRLFRIGNEKDAVHAAEHVAGDLDGLIEVLYDPAEHNGSAGPRKLEIKSYKKGLSVLAPEKILQAP